MKEQVGKEIAKRVTNGTVLGVGTGTTVDAALSELKKRVDTEGLSFKVVPSSLQSAWACEEYGFDVLYPSYKGTIDWGFDGADAVDSKLRAIKGKGGALLQEKILAVRCSSFVLIVDESKCAENIAEKSYVPIEVVKEASAYVLEKLEALGARSIEIRKGTGKHGPVITEAGNLILDATFSEISDDLEEKISAIVGVVESGLFLSYATEVVIASAAGIQSWKK